MSGLPLVTCPACQTEMGLEALLGSEDARAVVEAMARMPGTPALRRSVLRYCGLFAPAKQKLRWGRAAELLGEIAGLMESGRVTRYGVTHPAPLANWEAALAAVLSKADLNRPLKGHGYLLEVLVGMAERDAKRGHHSPGREKGEGGRGNAPLAPLAGRGVGGEGSSAGPASRRRAPMPESIKAQLNEYREEYRDACSKT